MEKPRTYETEYKKEAVKLAFDSEIITVDELMEMLYIGKNTAYQLLNSGEHRAFKIGKVWKIPKETGEKRLLTFSMFLCIIYLGEIINLYAYTTISII